MDGDSDPDRADRERQHDAEHQDQPPAQLAWLPLAAIHEPEDERDRDEADEEQCEARVDVAGHGLRVRPIDVPGLGHPDSGIAATQPVTISPSSWRPRVLTLP
jgi:hypothetical protein